MHNIEDSSTQELLNELANCRGIPPHLWLKIMSLADHAQKWRNRNKKQCELMKVRRNEEVLANVSHCELTSATLANGIYTKKDTTTLTKVSKKGSKILMPDTFSPNQEWAMEDRGWDGAKAAEEAEKFRGYCVAHGKKYADWDQAWRNWCRSKFQDQQVKNGYARPKTSKEQWGELLQSLGSGKFLESALGLVPDGGSGRQSGIFGPSRDPVLELPVRASAGCGEANGSSCRSPDLFANGGGDHGLAKPETEHPGAGTAKAITVPFKRMD